LVILIDWFVDFTFVPLKKKIMKMARHLHLQTLQALYERSTMAGSRVAHATLKGPSVVKELCIGLALGLTAGGLWKMYHWNEQRKVRQFYDLLEKGEISVVAAEE
jgi:hypothetical protein